MKLTIKLLALLSALLIFAAACSSGDDDADDTTTTAAAAADDSSSDDMMSDCDNVYHVITHGDSGVFWSVVERAVQDAEAAIGCEVVYFGSNNDAAAQSQAIEGAIADGSDGIAISLADPAGVSAAARAVVNANIPLYTLNSGVNDYIDLGAVTHIGQTEFVAGQGAGRRFNALGATTVMCARQEQTNVGLEERCAGLADTFNGTVIDEFVGLDATPEDQASYISSALQADASIDGVLGVGPVVALRALEAAETAGRNPGTDFWIGGFDLSGDLVDEIEMGRVAFTVDQQQYLQGYLPVVLMHLQATNANTAGGGLPVLTGPGFVTPDNATAVKALVAEGTR